MSGLWQQTASLRRIWSELGGTVHFDGGQQEEIAIFRSRHFAVAEEQKEAERARRRGAQCGGMPGVLTLLPQTHKRTSSGENGP